MNNNDCLQEIKAKLRRYEKTNVLFLDKNKLQKNIEEIQPITSIAIDYKLFNQITVNIISDTTFFDVNTYLLAELPVLGVDTVIDSSTSSPWVKPSIELEEYIKEKTSSSFRIWADGKFTPIATASSNIKFLISKKPEEAVIKSLSKILNILTKYAHPDSIYILESRIFLRRNSEPDIIAYVPYDEQSLVEALQSADILDRIKADARIIDLSFKNPIIR